MYPPYPSLLVWVRKILISIHNNSFATYIRQGKTPDGTSCHDLLFRCFSPAAYLPAAEAHQYSCNHIIFNIVWTNDGV